MKLRAITVEARESEKIVWINPDFIVSVSPETDSTAMIYLSNGQVYLALDLDELHDLMEI